jgi:hypothetical protein
LPAGLGRLSGREYVIKRLDQTPMANLVNVVGMATDQLDGMTSFQYALYDRQSCRVVSAGSRGWVLVEM